MSFMYYDIPMFALNNDKEVDALVEVHYQTVKNILFYYLQRTVQKLAISSIWYLGSFAPYLHLFLMLHPKLLGMYFK